MLRTHKKVGKDEERLAAANSEHLQLEKQAAEAEERLVRESAAGILFSEHTMFSRCGFWTPFKKLAQPMAAEDT